MKFILTMVLCLLCCSTLLAQEKTAEKKIYKNIQIEKFTIMEGVEFPAENIDKISQRLVRSLQKSKRFGQVSVIDENSAETTETEEPTLRLSGNIVLYKEGNQGARYILGSLGGQKFATRLVATIKFIDIKTGETVLMQSVDGIVSGGFFGGDKDDAKDGLTGEIVKIAKKNFSEKSK